MPFNDFLLHLAPVVVVLLALLIGLCRWLFADAFHTDKKRVAQILALNEREAIEDPRLLVQSLTVLGIVLAAFVLSPVLGYAPSVVALLGAGLLIAITRISTETALQDVEWPTLTFFMGLFVMVGGLVESGVLEALAHSITGFADTDPLAFTGRLGPSSAAPQRRPARATASCLRTGFRTAPRRAAAARPVAGVVPAARSARLCAAALTRPPARSPPVSTTSDRARPSAPTVPPAAPPALTTPPPVTTMATWRVLRPLLLRLHFYAGVFVAPFLAVACLTGLAYAFSPQLSDALYTHELLVGPHSGAPRPVDDQIAAALAAHPEGTLSSVTYPGDPDRTTGVVLAVPGLPDEIERTVYVDPYTAQVRGSLDTWYDTPPVQTTLDALHRNLLLGEPGRIYSELAASWLWVLVLGGLALWIGRRRRRARLAETVLPPVGARPGRRRMMGWHAATGVWLAIALLFISATGLTWSSNAGARFQALVEAVKGSTPALAAAPVPARDAPLVAVQTAVDTAHGAGLSGLLKITVPAEPGAPVTIAENAGTWPVQRDARLARPLHRRGHRDRAVAGLADHGQAHPDRHPRAHGQPLRARQPARPRGDGARPALRPVLGLPDVVAATTHSRWPHTPDRTGPAGRPARPAPTDGVRHRAGDRRRRLAPARPRRQPAGVPHRRRGRRRAHPAALEECGMNVTPDPGPVSRIPRPAPRIEVERVVADLAYWQRRGVLVLAVEPLSSTGARIGVRELHPLVVRAMRARYRFPVECWQAPVHRTDPSPQRRSAPS